MFVRAARKKNDFRFLLCLHEMPREVSRLIVGWNKKKTKQTQRIVADVNACECKQSQLQFQSHSFLFQTSNASQLGHIHVTFWIIQRARMARSVCEVITKTSPRPKRKALQETKHRKMKTVLSYESGKWSSMWNFRLRFVRPSALPRLKIQLKINYFLSLT